MTDKSYVTMEQHQCPVCLKTFDTGSLLLDRRVRPVFERFTLTGNSLCVDCKVNADDGRIALVVVSNDNDDRALMQPAEAVRTGDVAWLRRSAWSKVFTAPEPESVMAFIPPDVFLMLKGASEQ